MPIGLGVASLIGSGLSLAGGLFSNKKNIDLAREQMQFQERMSKTQYQRAAKDMEAAGLNRILALGGPASSPPGARPNITNPTDGMANSAKNLGLLGEQKKLLKSQEALTRAQFAAQDSMATRTMQEAQGVVLDNILKRKKVELFREKPWLFELQQMSNPVGTAVSTANQLLRSGGNAVKQIMKGTWK